MVEAFCKREKRHLLGDIELDKLQRKLKRTGILQEMDKVRKKYWS